MKKKNVTVVGIISDYETAILLRNLSNTMLNALNGSMAAADVLARKIETNGQQELKAYLSIMRHDQHKLLYIAENMRELASLRLDESPLKNDAFDLNALCQNLLDAIAALTDEVEIQFAPSPDGCAALGDAGRIERLLLNLLSNSFRHCAPGDRVCVTVSRSSTTAMVIVEDNGRGIRPEALPTLYKDYIRSPEILDADKGAGLGISVAEGIARLHGGTLLIEPQSVGTRAVFTMPYRWDNRLRMPTRQYGGYFRSVLTALADVLDYTKYAQPYL